jgi:toxin FitB
MTKKQPENGIAKWLESTPNADMFISVISVGELVLGVSKLADGAKKTELFGWLNELIHEIFNERIVDIDINVIEVWGEMSAKLMRSLPKFDTLIAASAIAWNMTVVTGNVRDFKDIPGLKFYNPREQ